MAKRQGQVEIMGLLLIILLVAILMLFVLYFVLSDSGKTGSQQVKESILAANTITTLRKTTTDCHGRSVEELLEDCARTRGVVVCSSGVNTCKKADSVIKEILSLLFSELDRDYYFSLRGIPYFATITYGSPCLRNRESKEQAIPVGISYDVFMKLDICR